MVIQRNNMKYVIYLRVSTDQQGLGLEAQRDMCNKYLSNFALPETVEFSDQGYGGALELDKRPGLLEAIAELEKGDILLISQRDRIGRDPIVNAMIERAVERKKARLISASGDVSDGKDPASILMRRMVDAFSEYERLIIGARTKSALQVKKKNGERVGHIPFGFRLCNDNKHLELDEIEQTILSRINDYRNKGLSFRRIANELNDKRELNRQSREWNHVSITRVMK